MAAAPGIGEDVWWAIDGMAAVPAVRRAAAAMAKDLRFDDDRGAEVGIVVTELATNLVRHAGGGELVLRALADGAEARLRVLAIDSGPGSRNMAALISDGASTRGTLGIGLGACMRLATAFDVYSVPGLGTVVEAILGPRADSSDAPRETVADLTRPLTGDGPCGDTAAYRSARGGLLAMVADGLGHGPMAAIASERAAEVLMASDSASPADVLARIHGALAGTRGAAVSALWYDASGARLVHAGVGNVVVRLLSPSGMRTLPAQPGIVGHRMPRLRELSYPVDDTTAAVMHSDGLTQRWSINDVPGVLAHRPAVVCGAVMRAAAGRRDDASVLVLRTAP